MRIALVSVLSETGESSRLPYPDGLASALLRQGHEVVVYLRRDPGGPARRTIAGVPVRWIDPQLDPNRLGTVAAALAGHWRRTPPAVVYAHGWRAGLAALAADADVPILQAFPGLPVVAPVDGAAGLHRPLGLARLVGRRVDRVAAGSTAERDALVAVGVPRSVVSVLPHGVDCDRFTSVRSPRPVRSPRSARFRRPVHVLTTSGDGVRDGIGEVLAAAARLALLRVTVVGDSAEVRRHRERVAVHPGLGERVRFVGRPGPAGLPGLLSDVDVVACAGWYGSSAADALAAMASSLPVVATDAGVLRDVVVPGVTGELVVPRRADLLATALARLAADPVRRQQYGAAGRDRVEARYTWDRVAADAARLCARLVADRGGAR